MDALGDHSADLYPADFGRSHLHNSLRNVFAYHVARAAGLDCQYEVPLLAPGTSIRPANILVQPPPLPTGQQVRPIACDLTVVSPFKQAVRTSATQMAGGAADIAHRDKVKDLGRKLLRRIPPPSHNTPQEPNFKFQPLAFDSLGAPSPASIRASQRSLTQPQEGSADVFISA